MLSRYNNYNNNTFNFNLISQNNYKNLTQFPKINSIKIIIIKKKVITDPTILLKYLNSLEILTGTLSRLIKIKSTNIEGKKNKIIGYSALVSKSFQYPFLEYLITILLPLQNLKPNFVFTQISNTNVLISLYLKKSKSSINGGVLLVEPINPLKIIVNLKSTSIEEAKIYLNGLNMPVVSL